MSVLRKLLSKSSVWMCCLGGVLPNQELPFPHLQFYHAIPQCSQTKVLPPSNCSSSQFEPILFGQQLNASLPFLIEGHPLVAAAAEGDLKMVKFLCTHHDFDPNALPAACLCAATFGHQKILKFLFVKVVPEWSWFVGADTVRNCCLGASVYGHLGTLKFLVEKILPELPCLFNQELLTSCSDCSSAFGHVNVLKFLLTKAFFEAELSVDPQTLAGCSIFAATSGHIDVLQFLFFKAYPKIDLLIDPCTFDGCIAGASARNQLAVLHFLFKMASSEKYWYLNPSLNFQELTNAQLAHSWLVEPLFPAMKVE